jgi:hypothetical protein
MNGPAQNNGQHIRHLIRNELAKKPVPPGWQQTTPLDERTNGVFLL